MEMRFLNTLLLLTGIFSARAMWLPLEVMDGGGGGGGGYNATDEEGMVVVGDMIMPPHLHDYLTSTQLVRKIIALPEYRWPTENDHPTVPFKFLSSALVFESEIHAGMDHWENHTCIRFRDITENDKCYIEYIRASGCWSYVGRLNPNQKQQVSIGTGCQMLGTVVHEIGHAVGFIHEQMRPDRDLFLTINRDNIDPSANNQFSKFDNINYFTYNVEYDYTSVMQYGGMDFTSNGKVTMATKKPDHQGLLGRGQILSHRDKFVVNTHYGCIHQWEMSCNTPQDFCKNGGYIGSDCLCICPPGTSGETCQEQSKNYYDDLIPSCSRIITEETEITSPNYPSNIPQGSWCVIQIEAPEGKVVQVTFEDFSMEQYTSGGPYRCASAFLEIRHQEAYDGDIFCGSDIAYKRNFISSGRDMVLYLDTPYSAGGSRGFKAGVSFVEGTTERTTTEGSASCPSTSFLVFLITVAVVHFSARLITK